MSKPLERLSDISSQCRQAGCTEHALSYSANCWQHSPQSEYLQTLKAKITSSKKGEALALHLKRVEATDIDFSHLDLKNSCFSQCRFSDCLFVGSDLSGTDMIGARFHNCDLVGANLRQANLTRAAFSDSSLAYADLHESYFIEAHFKQTDFMGARLASTVLWNADLAGIKHLRKKNFFESDQEVDPSQAGINESNALQACETYRNIKHYLHRNGLYEDASWAAYRELTMERRHFFKTKDFRYFPSLLMDLLSGYTEKPHRVIISSLAIVFFFSLIYYFLKIAVPSSGATQAQTFWDNLYFSFITFTTVGYGDLIPRSEPVFRILACVEAFSGPFMAGLYIFTLTRRYAVNG